MDKEKHILANRVYSDKTLKSWKKDNLIEHIRILEHNLASAEESLNNQAKNCEMLLKQARKETANKFAKELRNFIYLCEDWEVDNDTYEKISNKMEELKKQFSVDL